MGKRIYDIGNILDMNAEELSLSLSHTKGIKIGAVPIGEFRQPKKGEWYLSGAIPQAYKAPNNLSSKYHIAKLVRYKKTIHYEIVK